MNAPLVRRERLDLSVEAARERISTRIDRLPAVALPLSRALGRVLARPIYSPIDLPRFTNSAMDGFAMRSADTVEASPLRPVVLSIGGEVNAGHEPELAVRPGEAIRVGTGAAIPEGADAIVPVESAHERTGVIELIGPVTPGRHIRIRGEDLHAGACAVEAETILRPQEIGLLAALSVESVESFPAPRAAIVSIGAELVTRGQLASVSDANGPMLAALASSAGAHVQHLETCDDRLDDLSRMLNRLAADCDLIITSGGVSDSQTDTMSLLLEADQIAELWNVRLRPGKHIGVGFFDGVPLIALPGNPIAAYVTFELFGRVAIDCLSGRTSNETTQMAQSESLLDGALGRTDAVRGRAWIDTHGQLRVVQTENRGSGVISSLPESNCLILLDEAVDRLELGELVPIRWVGYQ